MRDNAPWTFREMLPGYTKRDAFEGEFFKGEADSKDLHGRTDALVREVIQNSLDAKNPDHDGPVHVRFAFSSPQQTLSIKQASHYLHGLGQHLDVMGIDLLSADAGAPPMDFLLIEDSGTRGLCGEPERDSDPDKTDGDQSFFWFWRNVGRSGKYGSQRGRWGLGKSVFPSASKVNSFFGLTVRAGDGRTLLLGQAITKIHKLNKKEFVPEGYFSDPDQVGDIQKPFEAPSEMIERFQRDFGISRTTEAGLSVVVPYPLEIYKPEDVLRSVIVHFFVPILKRELTVEVVAEDFDCGVVERSTIRTIADETLDWSQGGADKRHTKPPFDLAEWALQRQETEELETLTEAGTTKAPEWTEDLFSAGQLECLRNELSEGQRVAVRVPLTIAFKDGSLKSTYFDAFLEKDADIAHGEDHFVRGGMTISKVATLRTQKGARGLVLVDDSALSGFLGDAEGPAHTEWGEGEDRPAEKYVKWVSRLRFVKNSLKRLIDLLSPPPEGLDIDLLQDIFSVDDPTKIGASRRKKKKKQDEGETPDPPEIPDSKPTIVSIERLDGNHGFRIGRGEGIAEVPVRIKVSAAYAVPSGNPFSLSNYSPFDFVFDKGKKESVRLAHSAGVELKDRKLHSFIFVATDPDFSIEATGFDPLRDLVIDTKVLEE